MNDAALPVVYADETHNTGENLRDVNQPVFAVAGVHLDDVLADDIVNSVKKSMQEGAGEPKYTRLSRYPRGRATLLSIFEALPEDSVKVFIADKKFMTIAKIVDLGIEPLMFDAGYNMHADESARSLAHMVSIIGPVIGDSQKFNKVLDAFVVFTSQRVSIDPNDYHSATEEYLATVEGDSSTLRMVLLPSRDWLIKLVAQRNSGLHVDTLDPAVPTVVAVCRAFANILGPIRLVHDRSEVIARNTHLLLDSFPAPADPSRRVNAGVKQIEFGNSHEISQLQIADWVAGAARDAGMSKLNPPRKQVSQKLYDLVESWLAAPPLWPDQNWLTDHLG